MKQPGTVRNIPYGNYFLDYKITVMICAKILFTLSLQVVTKGVLELGCHIWHVDRPC